VKWSIAWSRFPVLIRSIAYAKMQYTDDLRKSPYAKTYHTYCGLKLQSDLNVKLLIVITKFLGLPRCKNLTRFSLFGSFCFAVRYCLKCFCFLCFTSSVSFTGSYTEVKPNFCCAIKHCVVIMFYCQSSRLFKEQIKLVCSKKKVKVASSRTWVMASMARFSARNQKLDVQGAWT